MCTGTEIGLGKESLSMNSLRINILAFFALVLTGFSVQAQNELIGDAKTPAISRKELHKVPAVIRGEDTMAVQHLRAIYVFDDRSFKSKSDQRKYNKLVRDVKIAYPYARMAGEKLRLYETMLQNVKTDAEKQKLMKRVEKELKEEYGDELTNLTVTQGRILLKLIDRETGDTSYELVKELRGSFSAFFWQSLAKLFGSDLKAQYDKEGADRQIEDIILAIQQGRL